MKLIYSTPECKTVKLRCEDIITESIEIIDMDIDLPEIIPNKNSEIN